MFSIYTVPSGPPQNLTGIAINSTAIALSWNAPRFENRNGVIRHYIVNVTEHQTGTTFGTVTTQMAIIFSSLHPYYTYVCTVYAVTIGAGPGAEPVSVTTMEDSKYNYYLDYTLCIQSPPLTSQLPSYSSQWSTKGPCRSSNFIISCETFLAATSFRATKRQNHSICCEYDQYRDWRRI